MKKLIPIICTLTLTCAFAFSQQNISVPLSDSVYDVLESAQERGLCELLSGAKPYSLKRIRYAIGQILENEDSLSDVEVRILEDFLSCHEGQTENTLSKSHIHLTTAPEKRLFSFDYQLGTDWTVSSGFYNDSSLNSTGCDIITFLDFSGDVTRWASYYVRGFFDVSYMPLTEISDDYFIGYSWYDSYDDVNGTMVDVEDFLDGDTDTEPRRRTIKKMLNTSYLPFAYTKKWDGQFYQLANLSASGTEGWATKPGFSGGLESELRLAVWDGKVTFGAGRFAREWAAMDTGSSLVLNGRTRPFFSVDSTIELFPFLKVSSLTGVLEYPNQDYMNENSYAEQKDGIDDSYFYQNAFSLNMIELDFKYLHLDLGSSAVWPKRFELGYMFPLAVYVEYQNHIGDSDNLALFGDIKLRKPGLGSIWASLYLDEINGLNNNPFTATRAMYAGQLGARVQLPWLSFTSLSMRYSKVEPYCYTHHSINYSSAYSHYISENYTNNGESLGYYLPPNADEFLMRFDTRPSQAVRCGLQYQFIRHGADYGSQQVPGSSLYSELSIYNRDDLKKYFLHDGAYNWIHIVSATGSVESRKSRIPLKLSAGAGFMVSYYTVIDTDLYNSRDRNGIMEDVDFSTPYHYVDNDEYPMTCGVVVNLGLSLWKF